MQGIISQLFSFKKANEKFELSEKTYAVVCKLIGESLVLFILQMTEGTVAIMARENKTWHPKIRLPG